MPANFLKTTIIALSAISASTAIASMFPEHSKDKAIIQMELTGQYIIQQPNRIYEFVTIPDQPKYPYGNYDPDKDWAFGFTGAFILPSHKYDIRASYLNLESNKTVHDALNVADGTSLPLKTKDSFDFANADLTIGAYHKFTKKFMVRTGAGLAYANIHQKSITSTHVSNQFVNIQTADSAENKFEGLGPELTLDAQFDFHKHWSIVSDLGVSALFGDNKTDIKLIENGATVQEHKESDNAVVWGYTGALGLRYAQNITKNSAFNIEAGYQGVWYQNALAENTRTFTLSSRNDLQADFKFSDDYYNYGPYVSVGLDFM